MTPVWIGSHGKLGDVRQVTAQYDRALLSNEQGQLTMVDISRPEMPSTWATYPLRGAVKALALQGYESLVASGKRCKKSTSPARRHRSTTMDWMWDAG